MRISEPSQADQDRLHSQIGKILAMARHHLGEVRFYQSQKDLSLLQKLLDNGIVSAAEKDALEALAVAFGAVLAKQLGLSWVMVEDDLGRDAALRYQETSVVFFPRRMIAGQILFDPSFRLEWLFKSTGEYLETLKRYSLTKRRSGSASGSRELES